jgi:hypothetical protein
MAQAIGAGGLKRAAGIGVDDDGGECGTVAGYGRVAAVPMTPASIRSVDREGDSHGDSGDAEKAKTKRAE